MTQTVAERFVKLWMYADSAEMVADVLGKPVLTILRMARYLRRAGVKLPFRPIEPVNISQHEQESSHG
jgi:hypothetical protein